MRSPKIIHAVTCHAEGEVGGVIVGGASPPRSGPAGHCPDCFGQAWISGVSQYMLQPADPCPSDYRLAALAARKRFDLSVCMVRERSVDAKNGDETPISRPFVVS